MQSHINSTDPTLMLDGALKRAYEETCRLRLTDYVCDGSKDDVTFSFKVKESDFPTDMAIKDVAHKNTEVKIEIAEIVSVAAADAGDDFLAIEVGAGFGRSVAALNKKLAPKSRCIGFTAEHTDFKPDTKDIVLGNIEYLPEIFKKSGLLKKPNLIFSRYTMNFLVHPLQFICDAYAILAPGGYLFLDHVTAFGLSPEQADALFRYLRAQGYDIVVLNAVDEDRPDHPSSRIYWGTKLVCIKKNNIESLNLPIIMTEIFRKLDKPGRSKDIRSRSVVYKPNQLLLDFIKASKNEENNLQIAINRLTSWGFKLPPSIVAAAAKKAEAIARAAKKDSETAKTTDSKSTANINRVAINTNSNSSAKSDHTSTTKPEPTTTATPVSMTVTPTILSTKTLLTPISKTSIAEPETNTKTTSPRHLAFFKGNASSKSANSELKEDKPHYSIRWPVAASAFSSIGLFAAYSTTASTATTILSWASLASVCAYIPVTGWAILLGASLSWLAYNGYQQCKNNDSSPSFSQSSAPQMRTSAY